MDTDFLIIGGGIAGISAAARLAPLGRVTLVEAEENLAYHASARSAALYEASYGPPYVRQLNLASGDFYHSSGLLTPRGFMILGAKGREDAFEAERKDMELNEISMNEACSLIPILNRDTTPRAAYSPAAFDIDTDALLQSFQREARAQGAEFLTKSPVTAIRKTRQGWAVSAGAHEITARVIINAAGAWVDKVATLAGVRPLNFQPYRRSMARIPAPGGHDLRNWPMVIGPSDAFYCKPDAGALIVSPCEADPMPPHDAFADDMVLAEGLARYEHHMTEPVTRMIANWAGLRTFAPDKTLVIGRDPAEPAFFWLAGQGGYGFQTCPAVSQLVCDLIGGTVPQLPAATVVALDPARFSRH